MTFPDGRRAGNELGPVSSAIFSERPPSQGTAVSAVESSGTAREPTISIQVVRGIVEAVHKIAGVSRDQLLRASKLKPEQLEASETRVPCSVAYHLCELAMDLTGDPALGLHWAERVGEGTFAPISPLLAHAASLRQAFDALTHFYRLLSDEASYEVIEHDGEVMVRRVALSGASPRVQRFSAEMMVGGIFRLIRYFHADARPDRISFQYSAPPYAAEYERVFGMAPRFDQPFTGIVLDRALLDFPAPHKDEEVHDALQALAERRLLRITQKTPYALRVRELLVRQEQPQRTHDMKAIARALGLSVRSLRRRLAAEGTSYNTVVREALAIVAKHLLRDKQRTIQETAYEMGFSDASTFHRAFKSWTGTTPSAYREEK
jgi:AraC-like DNA-binding protein